MSGEWARRLVLAKIESSYGVDAVATGAANAIRSSDPQITPLEGTDQSLDHLKGFMGASEHLHIGGHVSCQFGVPIAGSGTVAIAPKYGPLHRACGLSETVTPVTGPIEYDPVSAAFESASIYFNVDQVLHKLLGARGTVTMLWDAEAVPRFNYTFRGLFAGPADTPPETPDFTGFQKPLSVGNTNTPTFSFFGQSGLVMQRLSVDLGQQVVHRDRVNTESVIITGRETVGEVVFEAPPIATLDAVTLAKTKTTGALQLIHGTVADNIVQLDAPKVEIFNPRYSQDNGRAMLTCGLRFIPTDAGNDEVKITAK